MAIGRDQHAAGWRHDVDRRLCLGEPDRFGRVGDGAIEVALGAPDHRAVVNGCGNVGSSRIASLMSASAPSRSPSACFEMPRFCQENADGGPSLIDCIVVGDRLGVFALGAPGIAAVVKDDAARLPDPQRVVEIGDRDVVLALVVIGRAAQIVGGDAGLQADRLAGIRDHLRVVALLVPADRAPEIDRRELLAGKHLQRDDLVAGVDLLIGGRGVGGAERTELVAWLGKAGRRPQRGGEQGQCQDRAAHQVPLIGGRSDGYRFVAPGGTGVHSWMADPAGSLGAGFPCWADGGRTRRPS